MASVKLDDFFRVPKLEVDGSNWVVYKDRLQWAADARGYLFHLDGTHSVPTAPPAPADPAAPTPAETAALATYNTALAEWTKGEAIVKQMIASTIPDSLFMKVRTETTALALWTSLANEFQGKSHMVVVDLRRRLQEQRATEKDDLRVHFMNLRMIRENLASMGQPPTDTDFYTAVLGSLPPSYESYISAVIATSSVIGKTLTADELIRTVTEEYERRLIRSSKGSSSKDVAFNAHEKKPDRSDRHTFQS